MDWSVCAPCPPKITPELPIPQLHLVLKQHISWPNVLKRDTEDKVLKPLDVETNVSKSSGYRLDYTYHAIMLLPLCLLPFMVGFDQVLFLT